MEKSGKKTKEVIKEKEADISDQSSSLGARVLLAPWITEAATLAMELNKYIFKVSRSATKEQIKSAIEELYKVKVVSVNTIRTHRKFRNYGRTPGWKAGFKKALVTLKAGDKIELFEGA